MTWFGRFLRTLRFSNAVLPSVAALVAYSVSHYSTSIVHAGVSVVLLISLHSLVTIWNDIEDAPLDIANHRYAMTELRKSGGEKWLILGLILIGLLALVMCFLLPLASSMLAGTYLLVGWLYNAKPFVGSRRPLASIILLAIGYGLLPFLFGTVGGQWSLSLMALAAGWTLTRTSLSILKDYKDAIGDAKTNKHTFLLVYGANRTAWVSVSLAVGGAILSLVAIWRYGVSWRILAVLIGIAAWLLYERLRLFGQANYRELNQTFHKCLQYQIVFDGAVLLWALQS